MSSIVELSNVQKTYTSGRLVVPVLHDIDLAVARGEMLAIMGPSGSGKSTLMNIIGLLDRPTAGELRINGVSIDLSMSDRTLAALRTKTIGFVFQTFNLLPKLSALANVLMPTSYTKAGRADRGQRAALLLEKVGLADRMGHRPTELSGGENQRVAIARALINDPDVILADEPTGNLDSASGKEVLNILEQLNSDGKTVIVITHDPQIAERSGRIIRLFDGRIVETP